MNLLHQHNLNFNVQFIEVMTKLEQMNFYYQLRKRQFAEYQFEKKSFTLFDTAYETKI
jgi:hypothetical protein